MRAILVDSCKRCPWTVWDYRIAEFRCANPQATHRTIPEPAKNSEVPEFCPLPRVEMARLVEKGA